MGMNNDPRDEALDIIHDLTADLLTREDLPRAVERELELILGLARHKFDLLGEEDRQRLALIRRERSKVTSRLLPVEVLSLR